MSLAIQYTDANKFNPIQAYINSKNRSQISLIKRISEFFTTMIQPRVLTRMATVAAVGALIAVGGALMDVGGQMGGVAAISGIAGALHGLAAGEGMATVLRKAGALVIAGALVTTGVRAAAGGALAITGVTAAAGGALAITGVTAAVGGALAVGGVIAAAKGLMLAKEEEGAAEGITKLLAVSVAVGATTFLGCLAGEGALTAVVPVLTVGALAVGAGIIKTAEIIRERRARDIHFPFFEALLLNHLKKINRDDDKLHVLDDLECNYPPATWTTVSRSFVDQLVNLEEELTEKNTPDFFQKTVTIQAKDTNLLNAMNALKTKMKALSPEDRSDIDFVDDAHIPKNEVAKMIQSQGRIIAWTLQQNEMLPSAEQIAKFRMLHFPNKKTN